MTGLLSHQISIVVTGSTNFITPGLTNVRYLGEAHDESIFVEFFLRNLSQRKIHFYRARQDDDHHHHCHDYEDASYLRTV